MRVNLFHIFSFLLISSKLEMQIFLFCLFSFTLLCNFYFFSLDRIFLIYIPEKNLRKIKIIYIHLIYTNLMATLQKKDWSRKSRKIRNSANFFFFSKNFLTKNYFYFFLHEKLTENVFFLSFHLFKITEFINKFDRNYEEASIRECVQ